uniref:Uncharacterized protein n=1 Tax=Parascaris equorum TaxID=6256 RepID=A0A914RH81_PAREQ
MFNNFFRYIDIDPANVHILDGNAKDLAKECEDYEKKIKEAGGIELFIGGPQDLWVTLKFRAPFARANARFFSNDMSQVPTQALTDATLELKVKTVKYFKGLMQHHLKLIED